VKRKTNKLWPEHKPFPQSAIAADKQEENENVNIIIVNN